MLLLVTSDLVSLDLFQVLYIQSKVIAAIIPHSTNITLTIKTEVMLAAK